MQASVIVPTLNRGFALIDTLKLLLDQDMDSYQVIVVDQSPPYLPEVARQLDTLLQHPKVVYIQEPIRSLPNARNVGLAAAEGDYVIFVDDDVEVERDFVRQHCQFMKQYEVRAAAGRVIQANFPEVGALPVRFTHLARVEGAYLNSQIIREVDTFRGCNMAMERSIFDEVGPFDSNYTGNAAREESDVALRLKRRGIPILLNPQAAVVHLEAPNGGCRDMASAGGRPTDQKIEFFKNDSLFFMKFFNHWLLLRYLLGLYKVFAFDARFRRHGQTWSQLKTIPTGVWQGVRLYYALKRQGKLLL
jgi:GT2 family glycosyltransferase